MNILIISDGKPGHVNQARALCGIMGWPYTEAIAEYSFKTAKGATYLLDRIGFYASGLFVLKCVGLNKRISFSEIADSFRLIVAVGSAAYYPAKVCGQKTGLTVIALMHPKGFRLDFDHILCPFYDNPPKRPNITPLPITLSAKDSAFYQAMTEQFGGKFTYRLPAVGVIIGGDNKYERLCPEKISRQLEQLFALTPDHQHWVTTSRRTAKTIEAVVERFPFDYKLIYSREQYNPIPAFLTLCDILFVTSDSASMISECVSTGHANVELLKNITLKKSKFDRFVQGLEEQGCLHLFDGQLGQANKKLDVEPIVRSALSKFVRPDSRSGDSL